MLDQAGWHGQAALQVPANVTLLPLPPYPPELNPVNGSGFTCGSASCRSACVGARAPSWTRPAPPGTRCVTKPDGSTTLTSYPWTIHAIDQISK